MSAGRMMTMQLTVTSILKHALLNHPNAEIVSIDAARNKHRYTYQAFGERVAQLAHALVDMGIGPGDRVATLGWNTHRHLEIYYATAGIGAVCHTINPRLHGDQITYIINDAEDAVMFFDETFAGELAGLMSAIVRPMQLVQFSGEMAGALWGDRHVQIYDDIIDGRATSYDWPEIGENDAMGLCYTSGTTGNPKGVLYSHRATVLHAMAVSGADWLGLRSRDVVMPIVPMFHACAWGIPYVALMNGSAMVLPGPVSDGESLHKLIDEEGVTVSAAVPTVWLGLVEYLKKTGLRIDGFDRLVVGGSAAPVSLIKDLEDDYGVNVMHGWGMTELSPVGSLAAPKRGDDQKPTAAQLALKSKQGRALYGVEMRLIGDDGALVAHDGTAPGMLQVRGHWVADSYYKDARPEAFTDDGWFDTGDVATIDPEGWLTLTDRTKDVIKSGGEWISSIDLENIAVGHADVLEAACIAAQHSKWAERPLLACVARAGAVVSRKDVLALFPGKVAKWWIPDDVVFVAELPHTATGKISKLALRQQFADYRLPSER